MSAPRKSLEPVEDRWRIIAAIRAGCTAADIHLACSYPDCNCKQMPKAVEAAIRTYEGGEKQPRGYTIF